MKLSKGKSSSFRNEHANTSLLSDCTTGRRAGVQVLVLSMAQKGGIFNDVKPNAVFPTLLSHSGVRTNVSTPLTTALVDHLIGEAALQAQMS